MLEVSHLTKSYRGRRVVSDVSFVVEPGSVTGFVGPNGAGKSTTMRLLAGLERPDEGTATVNGHSFIGESHPLSALGCLLDAEWFHPKRSGRNHLRIIAAPQGIPDSRVDELIEIVGMTHAARIPVGRYSLGMRQRIGVAASLLGDPQNYLLDEPVNGLDVQGIAWLRDLLRAEAARGKAILLSSHLMSEMQHIADRVVVIDNGTLVSNSSIKEFLQLVPTTVIFSVEGGRSDEVLAHLPAAEIISQDFQEVRLRGVSSAEVAHAARTVGLTLTQLNAITGSLEDAYFSLLKTPTPQITAPAVSGPQVAPELSVEPVSPTLPSPQDYFAPPAPPAQVRYPSRKDRRK